MIRILGHITQTYLLDVSSITDGGGGGEDRLSDGCVEAHSLSGRLSRVILPLLGFLCEGADDQLYSVKWGVTQGNGVGWALPGDHHDCL